MVSASRPLKSCTLGRLLLAALALTGVVAAHSTSSSAAVFGQDDRRRLPQTSAALKSKIGTLVSLRTRAICSAFCVADDMIATASHCVNGAQHTKAPDLTSLRFAPAASGNPATGSPISGFAVANERQNIIVGTEHLNVSPPIDADGDWAIVRLAAPVCRQGGLPIRRASQTDLERDASAGRLYLVGVHRDFADGALRVSKPCPLWSAKSAERDRTAAPVALDFRDEAGLLFHLCDTMGGSSGAPLLVDGPNGPEVVAMNVGTYIVSRVNPKTGTADAQGEAVANTAVVSDRFYSGIVQLSHRQILAQPADVVRVEKRLMALGLYRGPARGAYSENLQAAIRRFERGMGKAETGLVSRSLLSELYDADTTAPMPTSSITPAIGEAPAR